MKKIIYIIISLLISKETISQTNYIPTGYWKYINGVDTIEFYFKVGEMNVGGISTPVLLGFHKYIKNGSLLENSIPFINSDYSQNKFTILIFGTESNMVRNDGHIKDLTLNNERYIILKKINPTTISVDLTYIQGVRNNRPYGFTMPRHFILTRL